MADFRNRFLSPPMGYTSSFTPHVIQAPELPNFAPIVQQSASPQSSMSDRLSGFAPYALMALGQTIATGRGGNVAPFIGAYQADRDHEREDRKNQRRNEFLAQYFEKNNQPEFADMARAGDGQMAFDLFEMTGKGSGELPSDMRGFLYAKKHGLIPEDITLLDYMNYDKDSLSLNVTPEGGVSFSQGPGTGPQLRTSKGMETLDEQTARNLSSADFTALENAREKNSASDEIREPFALAEGIIYGGYSSGRFAPIRGSVEAWANALGVMNDSTFAAQTEAFTSVSKQIGMIGLRLVGGNDTERELAVSIQTTVGPEKLPRANKVILTKQKKAVDILSERPVRITKWLNKYGSLNQENEKGQTFDEAFREYQRDEWGKFAKQVKEDLGLNKEESDLFFPDLEVEYMGTE